MYQEVEGELANFANLYVATAQLHAARSVRSVLRALKELLAQLLGAAAFAVYFVSDDGEDLVAIASEGPFFRSDAKSVAFREWLDELAADVEQLPEDAFQGVDAFRQTGVKTRLVIIDKP